MKNIYSNVACGGMDVHYKFSSVTFRDEAGRVVRWERLEHLQRDRLREHLNRWPKGLPMVLEASFGWGWLSDLLSEAGLDFLLLAQMPEPHHQCLNTIAYQPFIDVLDLRKVDLMKIED